MKKLLSVLLLSLFAIAMLSAPVFAGDYPEKAIKLVVPYGPGGGSDISARVFGKYFKKYLPVDVIVTNQTGGGGRVAETEVMNSRPDGYTILWQHEAMALGFATGRATHTYKNYTPIAIPLGAYSSIITTKTAPFNNFKELEAYIKANPKKLTWGFSPLSSSHCLFLKVASKSPLISIDTITVIPKNGDKDRIIATLQGNMMVTNITSASAKAYLDSGDIKMIGVASPERMPNTDYKTLIEQGSDTIEGFHYAMLAPEGMPSNAVKILADAVVKTYNDPMFQKDAYNLWLTPMKIVGEELTAELADEARVIAELATHFDVKK